jgi:penicillin-binding protein 1A
MARKPAKKPTKKKSAGRRKKAEGSFFANLIRFSIKWGFVAALWCFILLGLMVLWYASELPNITKSMVFERRPTVIIKAADGTIADRYGDIKGEIVDVKDLPPHVTNAVLAIEDRRFYDHFGLDIKGVGRAFLVNIAQGGFVQGGSTITQQLAKNLFLSRERTIKRKIQELILAFQLEGELTKDEILSAYLNRVYLGGGAYGIDAAAKIYFNKSARELNIKEAATIAGLLKAPSRYSPSANPAKSAERTKVVLQAMVDAGYVTEEEIASYKKTPPAPRRKPSSGDSVRYFTDYVVGQLDDLIGVIQDDIIVETTLDMDVQQEMEEAITKAILQYGPENEVGQAASIFMRLDGAVVGLMGGKDYGISEFNRVTDSIRQPGSSFKPIVYLTAIENGWELNSLIVDEPITTGRYRPKNFGHEYYGEVTLYEALTMSMNTVSVNLMREVGPEKVIGMARRLGITADLEPNLSLALGSSGVPMTQMATAYATIARGGTVVEPYAIKRITNTEGKVLYERTPPGSVRQVVSGRDVAQLTAMMQSVIQNGTGRAAAIPYAAAGKTGTSQDFRDAWFIGFTSKYVGAVWFGNDDNTPTKRLTGGSAPARVWKEVMLKAQTKGGRSYGNFSHFDFSTHSFDDLLSDILGSNEEESFNFGGGGLFNWFGGNGRTREIPVEEQDEYTPLGRHQYDLND